MKALAIIFTCVFLVSLIGFVATAAETGFDWLRGGINMGFYGDWKPFDVSETFHETYSNIDIGIIAARVTVKKSADGITKVRYNNERPGIDFIAEISGGDTLVVKEKLTGRFISWFNWGWGDSKLEMEIPENIYNRIDLNTVSGKVNAALPYTDNLYVNTTSGDVTLDFISGKTSAYLSSHSTSGNITINGFSPGRFDVSAISGKLNLTGLSGSGSVNMTTGKANLDFARWDGNLNVKLISGSAYIKIPGGSGADLSFSRASGSLKYNLNGDSGKLTGSGTVSVGGGNKQRVDVNLTSGYVEITDY